MDIELARANMIESQIRTWDVLDPRVLDALETLRREHFVPDTHRDLAFADLEIPLGHGQVMLPPKLEARLAQELGLAETDRVLEVGTGSGFQAALLSRLCARVTSVEILPDLAQAARARLTRDGITNVSVEEGNAAEGWERHAPYDAIVLTGSVPVLADALQRQLAVGGRLIAIVGSAPIMTARLVTCVSAGVYRSEGLFETQIPPLTLARAPARFVF